MGNIKKDDVQTQIYNIGHYLRLASNSPVHEVSDHIWNAQNELAKLNQIWQERIRKGKS